MANPTIIVLDPGHGLHDMLTPGKRDPGAVGFGKKECDFAIVVADKAANILRENPRFQAYITHSDGPFGLHKAAYNPVRPGTKDALSWRVTAAKNVMADVFVSIHWNGFRLPSAYGTCTCIRPDASSKSRQLAKSVQRSMMGSLNYFDAKRQVSKWSPKDRGILQMRLGVLHQNIPCCLVEPEFITNPYVNGLMNDESFLWTVASGIAQGIKTFLGGLNG